MKKYLLMIATIALMTACGADGKSSNSASGSEASDAPETYSVEYEFGSSSGSNYECFNIFDTEKQKTEFEAVIDGDKVTITMPMKVMVKASEIKGSLKDGTAIFTVENSSEKGRIEFKIADADKVDYDAEYKKLKEGDIMTFNMVGETTKDVLDKMNNNWGRFSLLF
ncbi:MAG: hypothetical protein J5629_10485 [Muribaculaceae bacterium]|nr:hypothetical protein [Muribaculaceae bacterium]